MSERPELNIALVSLGCPKNLVDSEYMADLLREDGNVLVDQPDQADAIVVNTCGFIESAKKEAIETILDMAEWKHKGRCRHLIVTGCLAQRYPREIQESLPEVDAILGVSSYGEIASILRTLEMQNPVDRTHGHPPVLCHAGAGDTTAHFQTKRRVSTGFYGYLKIAEGCSNRCAYCAIPGIRGNMISRTMEEILEEAQSLLDQGCKELVLIAQDTTAYGMDRYQKRMLPDLLHHLSALPGNFRVRMLYCYSDGMTDELLEAVATEPKILHYIDMPIQHGSNTVLRRMGRKDTEERIRYVVETWRKRIPDLTFRTTVMVGFPGETQEEFDALIQLIEALQFERLGCFVFSPEEGTRAATLPNPVDAEVSKDRERHLMEVQRDISLRLNQNRLGQVFPVLLESISEDGLFYLARSAAESPDIDPVIYVLDEAHTAQLGTWQWVRVVEVEEYDLTAVTCEAPKNGEQNESAQ